VEEQYIDQMETKLNHVHKALQHLAGHQPVTQLLDVIRKPGWTTVAEQALFAGLLDALVGHVNIITSLKQVLLSGASKVELNPQPLPPKE
jgi:hypothetical protein